MKRKGITYIIDLEGTKDKKAHNSLYHTWGVDEDNNWGFGNLRIKPKCKVWN